MLKQMLMNFWIKLKSYFVYMYKNWKKYLIIMIMFPSLWVCVSLDLIPYFNSEATIMEFLYKLWELPVLGTFLWCYFSITQMILAYLNISLIEPLHSAMNLVYYFMTHPEYPMVFYMFLILIPVLYMGSIFFKMISDILTSFCGWLQDVKISAMESVEDGDTILKIFMVYFNALSEYMKKSSWFQFEWDMIDWFCFYIYQLRHGFVAWPSVVMIYMMYLFISDLYVDFKCSWNLSDDWTWPEMWEVMKVMLYKNKKK